MYLCLAVPTVPVGPVKFSDITADSVTLTWSPPKKDGGSPIQSYQIDLSRDGKTWETLDSVDKTMRKYTVKDLQDGQTYFFRISAINDIGTGDSLISEAVTPKRPVGRSCQRKKYNFDEINFKMPFQFNV